MYKTGYLCSDTEKGKSYYKHNNLHDGRNHKVDTAEECRTICQDHPSCVAWDWVTQDHQDASLVRTCWIKSKAEDRKAKNNVVSGLRECISK